MPTAQIDLTEHERKSLQTIAQRTGKTQEELLREAVDLLIMQFEHADRRALLRQARGMWSDRTDIPKLEDLRSELDRIQK